MEDEPLAQDKLDHIESVVKYLNRESQREKLSWQEVGVIDLVYDMLKDFKQEDMDDYAHCVSCDKVINLDRQKWAVVDDQTFCGDCEGRD